MSKDNKSIKEDEKLKKSAVDRLVEAAHGDASGVEDEEVSMTKKEGKLKKIPTWIKASFIKWWFVGSSCFFFLWGLGTYVTNQWNLILVFGLGTGLVTDLLTNNFMRLFEGSDREYDFYILFTSRKKLWTLFANIAYALLITILVVKFYDVVNYQIIKANPDKYASTDVPIPVEPMLYSLVYFVFDLIVIMIKNAVVKIIKSNRKSV